MILRGSALLLTAALAFAASDTRVVDAVKAGDQAAVASLLQSKADVNVPEADGTTALAWAVRADDQHLVTQLLKAGADVQAANRYGITPLYLACQNGSAAMIEKLLAAGASASATVTEGETALMTASRTGNPDAVKVLLDHGAAVDAKESWHGETALMWAAAEGHPQVMRLLIDHGANVNARSDLNQWARQTTSEPREKWLPLGSLNPMMFAARQGCLECVKLLAEAKAHISAVDPDGISVTLLAVINGHYDVADFLVNKGADPNLADRTGRTALYSAVDFHTPPQSNRPPPRELASSVPSFELIKDLIAHGANVNVQLKTAQPYRTKLDRGDDTMLTTGTTPLLRAAKAGDVEVVRVLLQAGADPKLATRSLINPVMAAAGLGTKEEDTTGRHKTEAQIIETIDLCLKAGADVNAGDSRGQTALIGAAEKGYDKVIQFLADHGAKVDLKDKQGKTALDAALGNAGGGGGFDGSRKDVRDATANLLRQLMAASAAKGSAQ
jgi:ankyrin repeat protein